MAGISVRNVVKRYGGYTALDNVSLDIPDGEFLVLVGPSGCGKSTLLRMIAGLDGISEGEIRIGDRRVNELSPRDRDISMIFQTYALFPHMTVDRNLRFGMKLRGTPAAEADRRVKQAAGTLGLLPFLDRYPGQLSGGQRQRVAIGRALVRDPVAFLMDEPLANLDTKLRVHMRTEFARLREQLKTTTIYVTHDQTEAMTLGHRVCVMRDGLVQQIDTPDALYRRPSNIFVAGFIGSPEMNFGRARVEGRSLRLGRTVLPVPHSADASRLDGSEVIVGIRPSDFRLAAAGPADQGAAPGVEAEVELIERLGSEIIVVFPVETPKVRADQFGRAATSASDEEIAQRPASESSFVARLEGNAKVAVGQRITLQVPEGAVHLFDSATGVAIS